MNLLLSRSDIAPSAGTRITVEAATWNATPFMLSGESASKGIGADCSGSIWRIFQAAGCPFDYQPTESFLDYAERSGRFRIIGPHERRRDGDVLLWPHHMAIYSSFASPAERAFATTPRSNTLGARWTQHNDMWSAAQRGSDPFGPAASCYWGPPQPQALRYQTLG